MDTQLNVRYNTLESSVLMRTAMAMDSAALTRQGPDPGAGHGAGHARVIEAACQDVDTPAT